MQNHKLYDSYILKPILNTVKYRHINKTNFYLCSLIFRLLFFARFHTGNMRILMEEMSEEERKNFEIDASNINWKDYLTRIHISGVKKHVFEGKKLPI